MPLFRRLLLNPKVKTFREELCLPEEPVRAAPCGNQEVNSRAKLDLLHEFSRQNMTAERGRKKYL